MSLDLATRSIAQSIIDTQSDDIPELVNDLCCTKQLHVAVHTLNEQLESGDPAVRDMAEVALNRLGFI